MFTDFCGAIVPDSTGSLWCTRGRRGSTAALFHRASARVLTCRPSGSCARSKAWSSILAQRGKCFLLAPHPIVASSDDSEYQALDARTAWNELAKVEYFALPLAIFEHQCAFLYPEGARIAATLREDEANLRRLCSTRDHRQRSHKRFTFKTPGLQAQNAFVAQSPIA
eukprot:GEMP01077202.1.p1 GENE.GEMP01077202.1~~GEMP01077202.1.p1  ORF type:complete len:168 (-),score=26.28 GEMP01077202.1:105-608(-)